ncbi:MipA/OmpV family protein [Xanthomonas sp. WHRI 7945]|nr:MipA/OmpV family protein [Xanthomonas campestris pv. campestris]
MRKSLALLMLTSPTIGMAQNSTTADLLQEVDDDRWSIGVGANARQSTYAGEGTRIRPFPLVTFEGERIFWNGLSAGVHVLETDRIGIDLMIAGRFDGFDIADLGQRELVANGLNPALLEDRDDALDAGIAIRWFGRAGQLKLRALADVTDTSGGQEVTLDYGYALQWGKTTVVPGASVTWMSKDIVQYYYGITDKEVARGVAAYAPGAAVVPQVNLGFQRSLGEKWKVIGAVNYQFLPSEITDSPLSEPDTDGSAGVRIGITRSF